MTTTDRTTTVPMPALGEGVTEGTVTRWLKQIGDTVDFDEPLLEVATDKVDTEIPSPVAGVLTEILASEDDVVEIGAPLAVIAGEAATAEGASVRDPAPTADIAIASASPSSASHDNAPAPSADAAVEVASPIAAPSARTEPDPAEQNETIGSVKSEPSVHPAVPVPATKPPVTGNVDEASDRVEKLPRIRRTIAARMVESLQTAAQLTTVVEVDIARIADYVASTKQASSSAPDTSCLIFRS